MTPSFAELLCASPVSALQINDLETYLLGRRYKNTFLEEPQSLHAANIPLH